MIEIHCPECMKYCGQFDEIRKDEDGETLVFTCVRCGKKYEITVREVK